MKKIGLQKVDLVCVCEFLRGGGRFSHEGMEIAVNSFRLISYFHYKMNGKYANHVTIEKVLEKPHN